MTMRRDRQAPLQSNRLKMKWCINKGKKHFWGVPGKDYGLLTTKPNPAHINYFRNYVHTQPKQPSHNHLKSLHPEQSSFNSAYQLPQDCPEDIDLGKRILYTPGNRQTKDSYEDMHLNRELMENASETRKNHQKQQMQQDLQKHRQQGYRIKTENNEYSRNSRLRLKSKNVEISLPEHAKGPDSFRGKVAKLPRLQFSPHEINEKVQVRGATQIVPNVVRLQRRERQNNPTYCNSLAYPLPCYRYIA